MKELLPLQMRSVFLDVCAIAAVSFYLPVLPQTPIFSPALIDKETSFSTSSVGLFN
jgi:hypothetical protein